MSKEENTPYSFKGDNAKLVDSIKSLLALDSNGALVPNGVCGLARQLLESAVERLAFETPPVAVLYKDGTVLTKEECGIAFDVCCKVETPLFTRSDAGEVDRLNTVVEQQKNLIASLRAELRESYRFDSADTRIAGLSDLLRKCDEIMRQVQAGEADKHAMQVERNEIHAALSNGASA